MTAGFGREDWSVISDYGDDEDKGVLYLATYDPESHLNIYLKTPFLSGEWAEKGCLCVSPAAARALRDRLIEIYGESK